MKLSAKSVENMKPTGSRQEVPDTLMPGLYLIVQKTGKKSWKVRYRLNGKQPGPVIGKYPIMSLAEARERAKEIFLAVSKGVDPFAAEVADNITVADALDDYAKRKLARKKSGEQDKRMLDRFLRAKWADRQLADVTKADVRDLIDRINDSGRGVTANRCLAYSKAFFNWCVSRDLIKASPADKLPAPADEEPRTRWLNSYELRWFWKACDKEGYPFGHMAQAILLTACRLKEIAELTKVELGSGNGDYWLDLPGSRTKSGQPHFLRIPKRLGGWMMADGNSFNCPYVYSTTGKGPVKGTGKPMARIAGYMREIASEERGQPVEIEHWTYHDLRRTALTRIFLFSGGNKTLTHAIANHAEGKMDKPYILRNAERQMEDELVRWMTYVLELSRCSLDEIEGVKTRWEVDEKADQYWSAEIADQLT